MNRPCAVAIGFLLASCAPGADSGNSGHLSAQVKETVPNGEGKSIGRVSFYASPYGIIIEPDLRALERGPHALHLHEFGSCESGADGELAGAAGDHYDPGSTEIHAGPYGNGHLGDLPNVFIEADGIARIPVLAPRLALDDLRNRALMIHSGVDRYDAHASHQHGKGGSRMYCGVIR